MAWTYDPTDLNTTTDSGRLNVVRFLSGDTDTNDQQVQNEEIVFSLAQVNDNVYMAASFTANTIASKYARLVTTELDGQLTVEYGDLTSRYTLLAKSLKSQGTSSGATLSVKAGGLDPTVICNNDELEDRVIPSFRLGQFLNNGT
jgi:hypothetical protein